MRTISVLIFLDKDLYQWHCKTINIFFFVVVVGWMYPDTVNKSDGHRKRKKKHTDKWPFIVIYELNNNKPKKKTQNATPIDVRTTSNRFCFGVVFHLLNYCSNYRITFNQDNTDENGEAMEKAQNIHNQNCTKQW